jgi:hypothetical protein
MHIDLEQVTQRSLLRWYNKHRNMCVCSGGGVISDNIRI